MNRVEQSYELAYRQQMDSFSEGLWEHLCNVPLLKESVAGKVLSYLLGLACQAQNVHNITLGRMALLNIPRVWLVEHIKAVAEPLVALNEEWEYRRLLELYENLDAGLTTDHLLRGLVSPNPDIQSTAQAYLKR